MRFLFFLFTSIFIHGEITLAERASPNPPVDVALIFAINDYQNPVLTDLKTAVLKARGLERDLQNLYGFQTEVVENPNLAQILERLTAYQKAYAAGQFNAAGQLLVFFIGHGLIDDQDQGYFLPADANPAAPATSCVSYSALRKKLDNFICQHLLLVVDAPGSDRLDPNFAQARPMIYEPLPGETGEGADLLVNHEANTSRLFIVSNLSRHTVDESTFVDRFRNALLSRGGTDRILSSSELFKFLELGTVAPHRAAFGKSDPEGCFIFMETNYNEQAQLPLPDTTTTLSTSSDLNLPPLEDQQRRFIGQLLASPKPSASMVLQAYNTAFFIYIVDTRNNDIQFFWKDGMGRRYRSFKKLKQDVERSNRKLLFATNAGMYTPLRDPKGLYIEYGNKLAPLDQIKQGMGNFYLQPNGVFFIDKNYQPGILPTDQFLPFESNAQFATQSGPMLLINGHIHNAFQPDSDNLAIRSGVGQIDENRVVFAISNTPVNLYQFASIFKEYFGSKNALYLDGQISRMYLPELRLDRLDGDFGPIIGIVE